jgi:hypothetical protein
VKKRTTLQPWLEVLVGVVLGPIIVLAVIYGSVVLGAAL